MIDSPPARYWLRLLSSENAQFSVPSRAVLLTPTPVIVNVLTRSARAVAMALFTDDPVEADALP